MSITELRQVVVTPDGAQFDTMAEAKDYLRRPKILAALGAIEGVKTELATWLFEKREAIEMAFEVGQIRRVSKQEAKKLKEAMEHVVATLGQDKKAAFVVENASAILDSFRWPSVKRMDDTEKAAAARVSLLNTTEANEQLTDWILANQAAVLAAYQAGIEKRAVNDNATAALAAYRAEKAEEKRILETEGADAAKAYADKCAAARKATRDAAAAATANKATT